jgi:hypothetical protein
MTPEAIQSASNSIMLLDQMTVQDEEGWALVGTVGQNISNQSSFDPRNYGYASLSKLLAATQLFEFRGEGTGAVAVRDHRRSRRS